MTDQFVPEFAEFGVPARCMDRQCNNAARHLKTAPVRLHWQATCGRIACSLTARFLAVGPYQAMDPKQINLRWHATLNGTSQMQARENMLLANPSPFCGQS